MSATPKRSRNSKPDTRNLELKGRKWWCVQSTPPLLTDKLGSKLRENLQTSDLREAQSRRKHALARFDTIASERLRDFMTIAALSGLRLNEIGALKVGDTVDGVFNIRKAKTKTSVRRVPIHSALRGIISKRTKDKEPDDWLFPELPNPKPGSLRKRASCITQEFGRYTRDLGVAQVVNGRSVVDFHSFRRWFSTKAERADVPGNIIAAVLGHADQSITLDVYSAGPAREQLARCVEAVKLPVPTE